jgi:hypothetical protein
MEISGYTYKAYESDFYNFGKIKISYMDLTINSAEKIICKISAGVRAWTAAVRE